MGWHLLRLLFCGAMGCCWLFVIGQSLAASPNQCKTFLAKKAWQSATRCFFQQCRGLYQQKRFVDAAKCFRENGLRTRKLPTFGTKRFYLGRFWWGAILSLDKAAVTAKSQKALLYRESALEWLLVLRRDKLFMSDAHKMSTIRMEAKLRKAIGYARLSVETGHPNASTCLEGHKFKRCIDGARWSLRLRPGRYRFILRYPGASPSIRKSKILLAPNERKSLVFVPPKASKRAPLQIKSEPPGAQVFLDSTFVGKTPLSLKVYVGVRQIELKKTCYHVVSRAVAVAAARPNRFSASLRQEAPLKAWSAKQQSLRGQQVAGWSLFGGGALLALLGGAGHLVASVQHGANVATLSPTAFQNNANMGNTFRTLGYVGVGSGVTIGAIGGIWLLTQRLPPRQSLPCKVKETKP